MRLSGNRLVRAGVFSVLTIALGISGCSTQDTFEQPVPVPEVDSTVEFEKVWSRSVGDGHDGELLYLSPLDVGGTVYAASADGELLAVDAETGKLQWERGLNDRIFAGVGGDQAQLYLVTREADLVALSREDGRELWRSELPTEALAAPQSNGVLVVTQTTDGRVLAFDTATGEKRWQYDGVVPALSLRTAAAPLVGGDVVLASFSNGKLIALSADAGQPLWQYEVGQPQGRTELERLVDISGQPLVLDSAVMVSGYQGKLALVDIRTGQEIWSRKASSLNAPMVGGGNIYLSSANGNVIAYRGADRRELWLQDALSWRQLTQPAVYENYLIIGDYEGYLHVLSGNDGSLVGQNHYDSDGLRVPLQRLANGNLMVYGNSGKLSVFKLRERN
ncbi:MAG: outer membrane protein assembly factor BamB [Marinobacter sp.]|uniref:outer membrane protein assembly factor BamB n=1 Tax=Marinobacter sp. TaxID=50741 RepID=UPI001B5063F3|nr:outer membrane protein assembly factor BamB [Marinobacter sp.]MBQ0748461.1 outer membrane protein assembly factor BamB [Marinobacter sp.]MBQ0814611.1 outer membrane protein assembly factor BamB [Marinobacter sp.]|tara:strand:- start:11373 stop:12545 length:1173 start_codon:yes stop_codon:yes gene_type:complete